MLSVKNLTCLRNNRLLFRGLNFTLSPGEALHVQGANGVGKSSLLRILCGLLEPAEGEIFWQGNLSSSDPIAYHRDLGYLGHKLGLKERLTVAENLQLFQVTPSQAKTYNVTKENAISDKNQCITADSSTIFNSEIALKRLDVWHLKDHHCETLSAGQRQRVAMARLLVKNAPLWLLDEPFNAVDREGIANLESLLRDHVNSGGMLILTSHQSINIEELCVQTLQLDSLD